MSKKEENSSEDGKNRKKQKFISLMAKEKKLLTTADVMRKFSISASSLYRWRKEKLLPCVKISGTYYYSEAVLLNFLGGRMLGNFDGDL